ncbi:MAG: type I-E CRISPR-associated protein Cse1/CasA, partial [bacterium]|nr:type I-E CRISPR-associated protein Cse1/CasA [bacterium]
QLFWSMPRRIRLLVSKEDRKITCNLCGMTTEHIVRHYITKNLGVNYTGPWAHPLSPYFINKDGISSAIHPQPGGIGYRHWLGIVQTKQDNKEKRQPARVIEHFVRTKQKDLRLWAFGYDMDNMKARCWYDSTMPLILTDDTIREAYESHTSALVNSARQVSDETQKQIKKALFNRLADVKGDTSFIKSRFWQETEADFFECLYKLRAALEKGNDVVPVLDDWHKRLVKVSENIFNDISQTGADPKRIALAWRDLQEGIRYSKNLRKQLGLPVKTRAA